VATQFLIFTAPIDQMTSAKLTGAITDVINDPEISEAYIGFASGGGGVNEGVALHHFIKSCPKPVTMHALGNVDSIALTIFLAGARRYATDGTRFTFHTIGLGLPPGQRLDAPFLREKLAALHADQERLSGIWRTQVKVEDTEMTALFEHEYMHDCYWALQRGFIHEIRDFIIPIGSRLRHVA
jgi:ATP-dependent Clp protease protease subunit